MKDNTMKWLLFISLSFIWGSSFILMKGGLAHLTSTQVASIRIIVSGLVLLPITIKTFSLLPKNKIFPIFLSGVLGSLLPAYLFCVAEEKIDSSLAGTLNSLTPIFVIISGAVFFKTSTSANKVAGILIAFVGCALLFYNQSVFSESAHFSYILLIVLATFCYGVNVQLVHHHLANISSIQIVSLALSLSAIPSMALLIYSGYFSLNFHDFGLLASTGYSFLLGIVGTSLASVLFYKLIKKAGAIFSSMVTYGIPFVAILWGVFLGEKIGLNQILCLLLILIGVFIANKKVSTD